MRMLVAALLAVIPAAVAAQDVASVDQSKTYVSNPEACAGAAAGDYEAIGDALVLSFPDGIQAYEYYCQFFEVKTLAGSPFLLVEAVCEIPGARNPDLFSISPYSEGQIEVVSLFDSAILEPSEEMPSPGTTIYHACP